MKKCKWCGKDFTPKHQSSLFCSFGQDAACYVERVSTLKKRKEAIYRLRKKTKVLEKVAE